MKLNAGLLCAASIAAVGAFAQAQAPAAPSAPAQGGAPPPPGAGRGGGPPATLKVEPIKEGRVYWVTGGGGNSGIIIGESGVIVVDAKQTEAAGKNMVAEVAKLTPKPIKNVIITHSDGDHVNGIVGFPEGVNVIAHVNNRAEQRATYLNAAVEVEGGRCLPPRERFPNQVVVKDTVATKLDGVNIVLKHFGPAHTSGDLIVYLPDEKVAFTGDLITSNVLIHTEKAGSLDGWFANARGLLALDVESYVGGHANTLDTKATLQKRIADYQAQRDKVEGLMKEGKSLMDVKTAMGDPATNASGCRGIPYLSFAEVAYQTRLDMQQELK